MAENSIVSLT